MKNETLDADILGAGDITGIVLIPDQNISPAIERLRGLSATNRIEEMEENLGNEFYIFDGLALARQMTLFYAKPNTGKTLIFMSLLIEAINAGKVKAEDVFYINADDNYRGLCVKSRLAAEHGFSMISPAEAGVSPGDVLDMFTELAATNTIAGKVIIIDTLKKFTDMMSKKAQADFYEVLRVLVTKNASVNMAGHANKHLDEDGNIVYEGTSDTMNDPDCVYSMYRMSDSEDEKQIVEFRCEKSRGDNVARVSYSYEKRAGLSYPDMVASVSKLDGLEAERVAAIRNREELKEQYDVEILFVREMLENGSLNQTQITEKLKGHDLAGEITVRSLKTSLSKLTDIEWTASRDKAKKNALFFDLITTSGREYREAKGL